METISTGSSNTSSGGLSTGSEDEDDSSQTGTYVGIGIGAVAGLIFLILAARLAYRWYRRETAEDE